MTTGEVKNVMFQVVQTSEEDLIEAEKLEKVFCCTFSKETYIIKFISAFDHS